MKSLYKKRKGNPLPNYVASREERDWSNYCIDNNIRISQIPVKNEIGKWKMTINIGPYKRGEKQNISPAIYDKDTLYPAYYQMCKYYYDKYRK
jgi:hypothetical protein